MTKYGEIYDVVIVGAGPAGAAAARVVSASGLKCLIVEKGDENRRKICSGTLNRRAIDFLETHYGPLPSALFDPEQPYLLGIAVHFPSLTRPLKLLSSGIMINCRRNALDCYLADSSGTSQLLRHRVVGLTGGGQEHRLVLKSTYDETEKPLTIIARSIVIADGHASRTVPLVFPDAYRSIPWGSAQMAVHRGTIDLGRDCFHRFFYPEVGSYAWVLRKSDTLYIGSGTSGLARTRRCLDRFHRLLEQRFQFRSDAVLGRYVAAGPWLASHRRLILGSGNIVVVGDAAGFYNSGGEGISSALISGRMAGESLCDSLHGRYDPGTLYRQRIQGEVERSVHNFRMIYRLTDPALRLHFADLLASTNRREKVAIVRDMLIFLRNSVTR